MSLSFAYITSRQSCEPAWFFDSLRNQEGLQPDEIILIDLFAEQPGRKQSFRELAKRNIVHVEPMPNIFQGRFRITKEDFWAKSTSINTALCLCKSSFICMIDDRCVLSSHFIKSVREAMAAPYVMCGSYEKRHHMKIENGIIVDAGKLDGSDPRSPGGKDHRELMASGVVDAPGSWAFGCALALPLEWALTINGWPCRCDSMSFEDCIAGMLLANNHFPLKFDARAKTIQDRTPDQLGTPMKRTAKERFPNDTQDKAHTTLRWVQTATRSDNDYEIRELRNHIQNGGQFPIPNANKTYLDWWDGKPIRDL